MVNDRIDKHQHPEKYAQEKVETEVAQEDEEPEVYHVVPEAEAPSASEEINFEHELLERNLCEAENKPAIKKSLSSHKVAEYQISALPPGSKTIPSVESGGIRILPSGHIELAEMPANSDNASLPAESDQPRPQDPELPAEESEHNEELSQHLPQIILND